MFLANFRKSVPFEKKKLIAIPFGMPFLIVSLWNNQRDLASSRSQSRNSAATATMAPSSRYLGRQTQQTPSSFCRPKSSCETTSVPVQFHQKPSQNDRKSCHIVPDGIVDHWWHGDNCVFLQYGPECNTHNTNTPSGCIRLRFSWGAPCGKRAPTGWHRKSFDLDGASRRTMFTLPVECAKGNQRLQWCKSLTKQPCCSWHHKHSESDERKNSLRWVQTWPLDTGRRLSRLTL